MGGHLELHRHEDGPACNVSGATQASEGQNKTDIFPPECGRVEAVLTEKDLVLMGGRDVTLEMMAEQLGSSGRVGRPIVDETGLTGKYDFTLTWTPEPGTFGIPRDDASQDALAASFLGSMSDQLGLKLKAGKTSLNVLVIDHVERPSSN